MSTIQIRIDEKVKKKAKKVLDKLGLDMSGAIKLFLHQVVNTNSMPLKIYTENGYTLEEEAEIIQAGEEARRGENVVEFDKVEDLIAYLDYLKKGENENTSA